MSTYNVGYLIGSLSSTSINRKLALALTKLAPANLKMSEISFRDLAPYSPDYDADYPPVARAFKDAIAKSDAILFVTPEYNRSIPGALKNAIDWASRPYGENAFARKPSAVIGTSPGSIGTAVGQQSLRAVLGFSNSPQMTSPEAYIQFTPGLITDDGDVTADSTREFLRNYMTSSPSSSNGSSRCCRARKLKALARGRRRRITGRQIPRATPRGSQNGAHWGDFSNQVVQSLYQWSEILSASPAPR